METSGHASVAVAGERLGITAAGGALAMLGALVFWPQWERRRFPPTLAAALLANRDYLLLLAARLAAGGAYDAEVVRAKRRTERANSETFQSLRRMYADPQNQQQGVEHAAVLANGNQRLTRVLNVLMLQLTPAAPPIARQDPRHFARCAARALEALAKVAGRLRRDDDREPDTGPGSAALLDEAVAEMQCLRLSVAGDVNTDEVVAAHEQAVFAQLNRAGTELIAMLMSAGGRAAGKSSRDTEIAPARGA